MSQIDESDDPIGAFLDLINYEMPITNCGNLSEQICAIENGSPRWQTGML